MSTVLKKSWGRVKVAGAALLSVALISGAATVISAPQSAQAAAGAFTCTSDFYQVSSGKMYQYSVASNTYSLMASGTTISGLNGIGYNTGDNYIYGVGSSSTLYKIANDGSSVASSAVTGVTPQNTGGDFIAANKLLTANNSGTFTLIDTTTSVATAFTDSGSVWAAYDLAFNPTNHTAYGMHGTTLYIGVVTGTTSIAVSTKSVTGSLAGSTDAWGAAYIDSAGDAYFFDNTTHDLVEISGLRAFLTEYGPEPPTADDPAVVGVPIRVGSDPIEVVGQPVQVVEVDVSPDASRERRVDVRILEPRHDARAGEDLDAGADALTDVRLGADRDDPIAADRDRLGPAARRVDGVDIADDHQVRALAHGGGRYHARRERSVDRDRAVHPVGVVPGQVARELPPGIELVGEGERRLDRSAGGHRDLARAGAVGGLGAQLVDALHRGIADEELVIDRVLVRDDETDRLTGSHLQGSQVEPGEMDLDVQRARRGRARVGGGRERGGGQEHRHRGRDPRPPSHRHRPVAACWIRQRSASARSAMPKPSHRIIRALFAGSIAGSADTGSNPAATGSG